MRSESREASTLRQFSPLKPRRRQPLRAKSFPHINFLLTIARPERFAGVDQAQIMSSCFLFPCPPQPAPGQRALVACWRKQVFWLNGTPGLPPRETAKSWLVLVPPEDGLQQSGIRNRSRQTALPSATQKQRRFDGETDDKFKSFFPIRPRDSFRFADQLWELSCGQGLCRGMDI